MASWMRKRSAIAICRRGASGHVGSKRREDSCAECYAGLRYAGGGGQARFDRRGWLACYPRRLQTRQALQTLCELEIPLVMHSQHGYFHGMLQGTGLKNILLRREQFRLADQPRGYIFSISRA